MNIKRKDREITDKKEIQEIIKKAKILHLGLIDDNYPYIVPLHYGFEYCDENDSFVFFMHGAKKGHKIDLIKNAPNVFVEIETDVVLDSGESIPCKYGSFYSSFMGRGKANIIENLQEKRHGLQLLMRNQTDLYFDFTERMISTVAVIRVDIEQYTAKAKK